MTTKEQERKVLAQIKKLVESLGEDSYVGTAFEGCFEDAENNIEDDAAYSMRDRWESEKKRVAELRDEIIELQRQQANSEKEIARLENRELDLETQLREKTLAPDDMTDIQQLIDETIYDLDSRAKAAAQDIVKYADDPASREFQQAVSSHRNLGSRLDYYRALNSRVISAMKAGA